MGRAATRSFRGEPVKGDMDRVSRRLVRGRAGQRRYGSSFDAALSGPSRSKVIWDELRDGSVRAGPIKGDMDRASKNKAPKKKLPKPCLDKHVAFAIGYIITI